MYEFQFSYFTRGQFIDSSPENIFPLISAFENNFLPSYAEEISHTGVKKVIRIVGINRFENVSVMFTSESININMLYRDSKPGKDEIIERLNFITNALSKIKADIKAWRLASVVSSIKRVTQEYNSKMYSKFFVDGNSADYFEWNTRRAKRHSLANETLNVVATISRGPVMNSNNPSENFDAIVVQLDVNTIPENSSDRFNISNEVVLQLIDLGQENLDEILA